MGCRCFGGQWSRWPLSNCMCVRPVSAHDCCQRGEMDKQLTMQSSVIVKKTKKKHQKNGMASNIGATTSLELLSWKVLTQNNWIFLC